MNQVFLQTWAGPYIVSNIVAVALMLLAWKKPQIARFFYSLMFLAASVVNTKTAISTPNVYAEYAHFAWPFYRDFIAGPFQSFIQPMVLLIASGQFLLGIGFLLDPLYKLSCLGAILFFMAITPLGLGSAFPFTIFASLGCYFVFQQVSRENAGHERKITYRRSAV